MTFEEAMQSLRDQALTMMIHTEAGVVHTSRERGIKPLYELYHNGTRFAGETILVDRVIGLGAARIAVELGVNRVWTAVVSEPAKAYLMAVGIEVKFEKLADHIQNREGTGPCPVESIALKAMPHLSWSSLKQLSKPVVTHRC